MKNGQKNHIKKVLILRFGAIGDVVHSTALFRSLKKFDPDLEIHYIAFKMSSLLIKDDPDLKKVWIPENKSYKSLLSLAIELKKEKFDLFINLQPSLKTRIFSLFLKPQKTVVYKKTFKLHAVRNFWSTANKVYPDLVLDECLKVYLPDKVLSDVAKFLNQDKKTVAFNMGTSNVRQGRKWPIKYWKELAKTLVDRYNCDIILNGSKEDAAISEELLEISPNIKSFCGKFTILESAAIMSKCSLLISGDTGPLHIGTAVGTPSIGLYGAAPVSRTGPYGKKVFSISSNRKCVPCNRRKCKFSDKNEIYNPCMIDITPQQVISLINNNFLLSD